jgi:hypothetical protein
MSRHAPTVQPTRTLKMPAELKCVIPKRLPSVNGEPAPLGSGAPFRTPGAKRGDGRAFLQLAG